MEDAHSPTTLSLPYNTDYNISVVASFCGLAIATESVELFYGRYMSKINSSSNHCHKNAGKCENPLINYSEEFLRVIGYMIPAREGTNVTLSCSSGLELSGPNTSTCIRNGEWEPDPREAVCQGKI